MAYFNFSVREAKIDRAGLGGTRNKATLLVLLLLLLLLSYTEWLYYKVNKAPDHQRGASL